MLILFAKFCQTPGVGIVVLTVTTKLITSIASSVVNIPKFTFLGNYSPYVFYINTFVKIGHVYTDIPNTLGIYLLSFNLHILVVYHLPNS